MSVTKREQFQLLLNECDIRWPDENDRLAGQALAPYLDTIEAEAVARERARLREAVAGLPQRGKRVPGSSVPIVRLAAVLALLADPK